MSHSWPRPSADPACTPVCWTLERCFYPTRPGDAAHNYHRVAQRHLWHELMSTASERAGHRLQVCRKRCCLRTPQQKCMSDDCQVPHLHEAAVHSDKACIGSKPCGKVAKGGDQVSAAAAEVLEQRHNLQHREPSSCRRSCVLIATCDSLALCSMQVPSA